MKRRRVAIIGAGFSGAALAAALLRKGRDAPDVVLIERSGAIGPGLAYGTRQGAHLLNVRASNMSASAAEPNDFVEWLAKRKGGDGRSFAPRMVYGAYIANVLKRAASLHWFGGRLRRVRGDVVSVRSPSGGPLITFKSGRTLRADAAVLAFGNPPSSTPAMFAQSGVPLIDAWDSRGLARIPNNVDVLLIGTGLTMVDVVLSLDNPKRTGVIYALSRRGLTSRSHTDAAPPELLPMHLPQGVSAALHEFRREAKAMVARGEPWQFAIDRLRRDTPALWRRLSLAEQQRFLRHLRPWWDVHRHRAAPEIAGKIAALQASGKLRILAGEVVSATKAGRVIEIAHRQRGSLNRHKFTVGRVVNCTGANLDFANNATGLAAQLEQDGVARAAPCGLGLDVDADGRVIDAAGVPIGSLFALGPITQGAYWESTAVPEIRARAAALADLL